MSVDIYEDTLPKRLARPAIFNGARGRCPNCGTGKLFRAYLKTKDAYETCDLEFHHHRADDAPPYFTILIVSHVVVSLMLMVEQTWKPDLWIHAAIWLPMTLILSLSLLPIIKGALIGVQWAMYMHGFDPNSANDEL